LLGNMTETIRLHKLLGMQSQEQIELYQKKALLALFEPRT
jgi:hypothetical protein